MRSLRLHRSCTLRASARSTHRSKKRRPSSGTCLGSPSDLHQRLQDLESGKLDERLREEAGIPDETLRRKRRAEAADASADDDDEADEHLQVEQDLLGDEGPAEAHVPETPEQEERTPHPATTYKSRARRRTESRGRSLTADESLSRTPSPGRSTRRSRRATPEADEHSASEDGHGTDGVSDAERDKSRRRTTQVLLMLHNEVSNHTHGNLFHQAIKEADAPDYYSLIKQPMDLKLIKQRIKEGTIASALDLRRALSLMFANALMYNRPDTEVHRMANEMRLATDEVRARSLPRCSTNSSRHRSRSCTPTRNRRPSICSTRWPRIDDRTGA